MPSLSRPGVALWLSWCAAAAACSSNHHTLAERPALENRPLMVLGSSAMAAVDDTGWFEPKATSAVGGLSGDVAGYMLPPLPTVTGTKAIPATQRPRIERSAPTLPGEYQPPEYLLIGFDEHLEEYLLDIVQAGWGQARLVVLVAEDEDVAWFTQSLEARHLDPSEVIFVRAPIESPWVRDYGPLVVEHANGQRSVVDMKYCKDQPEDKVPRVLADELWQGWGYAESSICLDGGNLLSDGTGRCFTTAGYRDDVELGDVSLIADEADQDPPIDPDLLRAELRQKLGCNELFILPPLYEEATGHVDMYLTITGPGQALVGEYDMDDDWFNALRLDEVAQTLRDGGMTVTRLPMPDHADGLFRSYTNALALRDVVMVPVYPESSEHERRALRAFQRAYPDRRIAPIVSTDVIELQGAVHCTTMSVNRR